MSPEHLHQSLERVIKNDRAQVLAILASRYNDLQLAEDALQDTLLKSLQDWQKTGIPENPRAWIIKAASRKMIDQIRRNQSFNRKESLIKAELLDHRTDDDMYTLNYPDDEDIPDERLRLMFTCCHPALDLSVRVPLTLQVLGGLTTSEIAKSFLIPTATMAQRLVRAKRKIKEAAIPYEIPKPAQINERLNGLLKVLYLIYNEGYSNLLRSGKTAHSLIEEAIRLTKVLVKLTPKQAEPLGLLSLMLHQHARGEARYDKAESIITLDQQNRKLWNQNLIQEAQIALNKALLLRHPGPYQIQAAISALHNESPDHSKTDWNQIHLLYKSLYRLDPSPIVEINSAVALSYAQDPLSALEALSHLESDLQIQNYLPYQVACADLFRRLGQHQKAHTAYLKAISLTQDPAEIKLFESHLNSLTD